MQRADPQYATRADANFAHFLLARPDTNLDPYAYARLALRPGSELNAVGVWVTFHLTALLLILMPASLHPWYVVLVIPFLTVFPSVAWLLFSCTVTLSYLKYAAPSGVMPTWVLLIEYVPLFALLAAELIFWNTGRRRMVLQPEI